MSRIFLSYRRSDSSGYLVALYPRLEEHFGRDNIFRDIDTIDFGVDYVKSIEDAVQSCDVLLAMIGPHWVSIEDAQGRRRLDNPNDFVRLEVATALARGIHVIPVLVGGVAMPNKDNLPDDLKPLARRNALEMNDRDFDAHVLRLIAAVKRVIDQTGPLQEPQSEPSLITAIPATWLPPVNLPRLHWIKIPSGRVEMEKYGSFNVPTFAIAKYPVTVEQYGYFVDDGGYLKRNYWTEKGWEWREERNIELPNFWEDSKWYPDNPVVGTSWYEAMAFCRWLSENEGYTIALPTELHWQRAAQGDGGIRYPWGNHFGHRYANTIESEIGKTTPVDKYREGASIYGVMDMSGNIWEWCLNEYGNLDDPRIADSVSRALRGGAYDMSQEYARCRRSSFNRQYNQVRNVGFRLFRPSR